jgi:hypothetical protein
MNVLSLLNWANRAFEFCEPSTAKKKFVLKAVSHMARFNEQKLVRDWVTVLNWSRCILAERIMNNLPLKGYYHHK